MFAIIYSFSYAILISALSASTDSELLKALGFMAAGWMALAGAIAGWTKFRK